MSKLINRYERQTFGALTDWQFFIGIIFICAISLFFPFKVILDFKTIKTKLLND